MSEIEHDYIDLCMQKVASQYFPLKAKEDLKQRDLSYIIQQIEDTSGTRISLSTIKRLFKNEFQKLPHPATLKAMVSVLGYKDWQDFKKSHQTEIGIESSQRHSKVRSFLKPTIIVLGGIGLIVLSTWLFIDQFDYFTKNTDLYISDEVEFSVKQTIDKGVPNSVIFTYDLKDSRADSFFIQRSWNPSNKVLINEKGHHFAEVYYSPGYHWAKLIANEQQIATQRVHVKTDGWFASVKYNRMDQKPLFLNQNSLIQNGAMEIGKANFIESGLDIEREFYLRYYNIRDFNNLSSDDFTLQTRVKCTGPGQSICPYLSIMLVTEGNVSYIDLSSVGCVGEIKMMFGDTIIRGRDHDLSALGVDVMQWQNFEWKTQDKHVTLSLNEEEVYTTHYNDDFGAIVGIIFTFSGGGSVDYIRLLDKNDQTVYADEF